MSRLLRPFAALALAVVLASPLACQEKQQPASAPAPLPAGVFRMTVLGLKVHGLAIVLQTPSGAVYVVDTGKKDDDYDAGHDAIAPFLKARGIEEIAGIVVSHPHRDHYEGAAYLLKHFKVKSFSDAGLENSQIHESYHKLVAHARERGAEIRTIRAGEVLKWDEALEVTVLAPPKDGLKTSDESLLNNNSIVLRIQHGKNVFLLPGDLESEGRDALLAAVPHNQLKATVLVAPHHGFAEGHRFAETVKPEYVMVSCLDHYADKKIASPGRHATDFYGAVGARVWVTAWNGSVEVTSDGSACTVRPERESK